MKLSVNRTGTSPPSFTETWIQLTPDQKMRQLNRLLTFKSKSSVSVTSTDGTLTVPIVSNVALKPGQRKRVVNAKTTTISGKRSKIT